MSSRRTSTGTVVVTSSRRVPTVERSTALAAAARRLVEAAADRRACEPIRHLLPDAGIDDGYAVQQLVAAMSAPQRRRRVGRKIGLTSPAVQAQMGVDQPDFGVLYADMSHGDDELIVHAELIQPRVEVEVAFILGADLPDRPVITSDVLRATDVVVPAIEVVDSRIRGWDISIFDTVADNASSGRFVLGGAPRRLADIDDLRDCRMQLTCDGEEVSAGSGAACLGHPLNAVVWLANAVAERGAPLLAGEVILAGALGPLAPAKPGRTYHAVIGGLGSVRARFV